MADLEGMPGARPPTGPNYFVFAYIFTKKCPRQRSTPPNGPTPPTGNPGSGTDTKIEVITLTDRKTHTQTDRQTDTKTNSIKTLPSRIRGW